MTKTPRPRNASTAVSIAAATRSASTFAALVAFVVASSTGGTLGTQGAFSDPGSNRRNLGCGQTITVRRHLIDMSFGELDPLDQ
jgi:hypothetical protein